MDPGKSSQGASDYRKGKCAPVNDQADLVYWESPDDSRIY